MTPSPFQVAIVKGGIFVLWAILTVLDAFLVFLNRVLSKADAIIGDNVDSEKRSRVVIVGASFAGVSAYRDLIRHSRRGELEITIIEYKAFFEYVPGILRSFVDPAHFNSLTCSLDYMNNDGRGTKFVQGNVVEVDRKSNIVKLQSGRTIPYDYLILATGSTYPGPIKATVQQRSLSARQRQINKMADEIESAETVCIVGAGAVGVELAAEIADNYPPSKKRIVLIDLCSTILPGFPEGNKRYCRRWLEKNGVELMLGTSLKSISKKSVTFPDGTKLQADIVFKCIGPAPATAFLKDDNSFSQALRGPKAATIANKHLQVDGFDNIFCAGDVCYLPTIDELNLGHTACLNGSFVALNVLRMVRDDPGLLLYPKGLYGNDQTPKIVNVSLGKYDASLRFNGLEIHGSLPAILKWKIEWTQIAAAANRPVGRLFWIFADWMSFFLSRTILPTPTAKTKLA